ncbi:MAG: UDP-N-acetylmuramate dehydrogenase [Actinobacteria bacterium]|nr:UDP-N-acetylmuramate dehydrogenase [Actinomycetota bacterium]
MRTESGVKLSSYTTLCLGGPATTMVTAYDEAEVLEALRSAPGPVLVLGSGSNLVVGDAGFDGTVVRIASKGITTSVDGADVLLEVAAGEDWDALVARTVADSLAGMECLAGIPGLVGATPVQNVGAYGQDVSQTVASVRAYDRDVDCVRTIRDCGFGYRWSRFKAEAPRWVVLSVTYRLAGSADSNPIRYAELARALGVEVGDVAPLVEVRDTVLSLRRSKGMVLDADDVDSRSAGSFFTNPLLDPADVPAGAPSYAEPDGRAKVPAAWLIEQAGFGKGHFDGPVGISSKHTLALVNRGGATTADLVRVARAVRDGVRDRFGIELVPEPVLVGVEL